MMYGDDGEIRFDGVAGGADHVQRKVAGHRRYGMTKTGTGTTIVIGIVVSGSATVGLDRGIGILVVAYLGFRGFETVGKGSEPIHAQIGIGAGKRQQVDD